MPQDALDALTDEEFVVAWRSQMAETDRDTHVCLIRGRVIGFVSFGPCRDDGADRRRLAEIYGIYLIREAWGRGHGRRLLQFAVERLGVQGFVEVLLWVLRENDRARRFYERAGLRLDPEAKKVVRRFDTDLHHVCYRRDLTPASLRQSVSTGLYFRHARRLPMPRLPWIERKWIFDYPVEVFPDILERLRGLPPRVEDMVRRVPDDVLAKRQREGTWSIKENIGHLIDTEKLPMQRIDEFLSGAPVLVAADMSNRATHEANHNDRPISDLLGGLRHGRRALMDKLDALSDGDFARTSKHPRLGTPMRLVDLCLFTADHDDYHVARMRELLASFGALE